MTDGHYDALMARDEAEPIPCPRCHAGPGAPCVNPFTGRPLRYPCWPRSKKARQQAEKENTHGA